MRHARLPSAVLLAAVLIAAVVAPPGCKRQGASAPIGEAQQKGEPSMPMTITSAAFRDGAPIPARYTGDGANLSPPLAWSGLPPRTVELALVCDDPDAPRAEPWVHWVIYKLPAATPGLPEGIGDDENLSSPAGAMQGVTTSGSVGYRGPAPPSGHGTHHYRFHLYALDAALPLQPRLAKERLLEAVRGHVLAEAELVGTYQR